LTRTTYNIKKLFLLIKETNGVKYSMCRICFEKFPYSEELTSDMKRHIINHLVNKEIKISDIKEVKDENKVKETIEFKHPYEDIKKKSITLLDFIKNK